MGWVGRDAALWCAVVCSRRWPGCQRRCVACGRIANRTSRRPTASTACRPEPVLRRALDRLIRLLREGEVNYFYALDQFKVGG